jgi:hypothetical protein
MNKQQEKHPAPWTWHHDGHGGAYIGDATGRQIGFLSNRPDQEELARLITSAPTLAAENAALRASRDELLAALQMAHGVLFLLTDEVRALGHGAENIPAKVSAAISAATGQPS